MEIHLLINCFGYQKMLRVWVVSVPFEVIVLEGSNKESILQEKGKSRGSSVKVKKKLYLA
jgi:hypothetical protein